MDIMINHVVIRMVFCDLLEAYTQTRAHYLDKHYYYVSYVNTNKTQSNDNFANIGPIFRWVSRVPVHR